MSLLNKIQQELKAPKGQYNSFGKYHYRSCEDIVEAVKPLLGIGTLTISDEVVCVGARIYVKATATLQDGDKKDSATGWAREAEVRKGMDDSQITGATSSYARKYALNGLFLIDDTRDADTQEAPKPPVKKFDPIEAEWKAKIEFCTDVEELKKVWGEVPTIYQKVLAGVKDAQKAVITK